MSGKNNTHGNEVNDIELFMKFDCLECVDIYQDVFSISNDNNSETNLEVFFIGKESSEYSKLVGLLAAQKQDKYSEFLNEVFIKGSKKPILEIAGDIDLNLTIFEEDINSEETNALAQEMISKAEQRGIISVPTVILNNRIITFDSLEELDQIILGNG